MFWFREKTLSGSYLSFRATSRTYFYNPMVAPKNGGGGIQMFYVGGYYNDRLVRTADGWRIADRFEETAWMDGALPTNLEIPS